MKTKNNTGFYRVSKAKDSSVKQGFRYVYSMHTELFDVDIRSIRLLDLKMKVTKAGFHWGILNKPLALETCKNEGVNPLKLNSNLNSKYLKQEFTVNDLFDKRFQIEELFQNEI